MILDQHTIDARVAAYRNNLALHPSEAEVKAYRSALLWALRVQNAEEDTPATETVVRTPPPGSVLYTIALEPMSTNRSNHIVLLPTFKGSSKKRPMVMKTKEAQAWMERATYQLKKQKRDAGAATIEGPVELWVEVWRKTRVGDVDNYAKGVLDALQEAQVVRDDKQVVDLHMHKRHDSRNPRYVIRIAQQPDDGLLFELEAEQGEEVPDVFKTEEERKG